MLRSIFNLEQRSGNEDLPPVFVNEVLREQLRLSDLHGHTGRAEWLRRRLAYKTYNTYYLIQPFPEKVPRPLLRQLSLKERTLIFCF